MKTDWKLGDGGYSEEELKIIRETRKILGEPSLRITATTARVPVRLGHSEAINLEFDRPISVAEALECLRAAPGISVVDDYATKKEPTPLEAEGHDEVFVGRVRQDLSVPHGLNLWVVSDNLRKGAATNAVQIAEYLIKRGLRK